MTRVVLMEDYLDHVRQMPTVRQLAERVDLRIYTDKAGSEDEVARRIEGADIAITIRDRVNFNASLFGRIQSLKLLSVCGPRLDPHVDLAAATRAGVLVCRAPANQVPREPHHATAELTWALILGLTKSVLENQSVMQTGGWQTKISTGLLGKTLGVVGSTGKVGEVVTRIGVAMGMRVIAFSPRLTPERAREQGAESVPLDQLLRESDVVTLHANATPATAGMMGTAQFQTMKPTALFINTARAALVDEAALREALEQRRIAGAGMDVYWQEPLPTDHWLRRQDRVLLQPHLGGFTTEGYEWIVAPGVQAVLDYLDGRPINVANPEAARA